MSTNKKYCNILISDIIKKKEKDATTIEVQMTVSPKLNDDNDELFQSLNIPRSNSLDNNYFTLHYKNGHNRNNINRSIYLNLNNNASPSLFPLSGYQEQIIENMDDNINLTRSFSLNTTIIDRDLISTDYWKPVTNNNNNQDNNIYPDMSRTTIKPPILLDHEIRIPNQYGTIHAFTVRGSTIILSSSDYTIKSFHFGENTFYNSTNNEQTELIKSVCFSPAIHPIDDHKIIWAGTESGSILAIDILSNQVLIKRMATHCDSINFILRHKNTELWTIDQSGQVNIWINKKNNNNITSSSINLLNTIPERFTITSNIKTAILSLNKSILWCSAGRSIDKLDRSKKYALPLIHISNHLGGIIQLVIIPFHKNQIFALHSDDKITVWDLISLNQVKSIDVSLDKLSSLTSVGDYYLWVGYNNGTIAIYDTRFDPWVVIKIWKAHSTSVVKLQMDDYSMIESISVVSMDSNGNLAIWDALLTEDWFEERMISSISEYSNTKETSVMICSWNMDAIKPDLLNELDKEKLHEWLYGITDPDIIMIGIQEIVDLGSKTMTAKSLLTSTKKIETIEEADELLTHRYMLWLEYFISIIETNFGKNTYKIIKTDQMVGLFSCIFIKSIHEPRIQQCDSTIVKTGFRVMAKGLHGNKGGIATRFIFDDTSFCFVNCHLASGQSHVLQRNEDLEGVLNSAKFPEINDPNNNVFNYGTNGTCILDHENCFLSGDLNYRIDMSREQIFDLLSNTEINKFEIWEQLQHQDQLKNQQITNPLFRLFNFKEAPILFDPTYKYDRGIDLYDSSEKKRSPAWCDRVLYRAPSNVNNIYYRRHEVKASDHRPISAGFVIPVKEIIPEKKDLVKQKILSEWQLNINRILQSNKIKYITHYELCDENEAQDRLEKSDWDVEKVVIDLYHDKASYI